MQGMCIRGINQSLILLKLIWDLIGTNLVYFIRRLGEDTPPSLHVRTNEIACLIFRAHSINRNPTLNDLISTNLHFSVLLREFLPRFCPDSLYRSGTFPFSGIQSQKRSGFFLPGYPSPESISIGRLTPMAGRRG